MKEWLVMQSVQCAIYNSQNAMIMNTTKTIKKQYIAPQLLLEESFKVELGYAASNWINIDLDQLLFWSDDDPVELYDDRNGWEAGDENNHFWD